MDAKNNVDLNDVALLVRVVQTHSFSSAARECGVPVSTVSRRVARLEAALGIRLLERTTRRLRLTGAGQAYFAHAERALDDLAQGGDRVRELRREPQGRVRVAAPIALGGAVSGVVYTYLAAHPRVSVDLQLDERRIEQLAEDFDVAVLAGRTDLDSSDLVVRQVWQSSRKLLYASPRYLEMRGRPHRLADLARHDCISTRAGDAADGGVTWTLTHAGRKRRVTFSPRLCVNEFSAVHRAVLAGLGIAMLPERLSAADVQEKRLCQVLEAYEGESGGVYLLYRAQRSLTAAVRTCIDHMLAELPACDPALAKRRRRGAP